MHELAGAASSGYSRIILYLIAVMSRTKVCVDIFTSVSNLSFKKVVAVHGNMIIAMIHVVLAGFHNTLIVALIVVY